MHQKITGFDSEVMKTWEFVERYSDKNWATTKSGYNPLKEDFMNTSFFISDIKWETVDYFSQLLIEAHQEGTLSKINDVFARAEAAEKNSKKSADTLRNPSAPAGSSTGQPAQQEWSSWTIPGLAQSTIGVVPVPGMNLTLNLGKNEAIDKNMDWMRSFIPYRLVQIPNGESNPNPGK